MIKKLLMLLDPVKRELNRQLDLAKPDILTIIRRFAQEVKTHGAGEPERVKAGLARVIEQSPLPMPLKYAVVSVVMTWDHTRYHAPLIEAVDRETERLCKKIQGMRL